MLDIKFIRENAELIKKAALDKRIKCDVDRLIEVDRRRCDLQMEMEGLRTQVNENGQMVGLMRNPKSPWYKKAVEEGKTADEIKAAAEEVQRKLGEIKPRLKALEDDEKPIIDEFEELMLTIPQPSDPEVPVGEDDTQNVEIKRVGEIPTFDFELKDHVTLGRRAGHDRHRTGCEARGFA